MKSVSAVLVDYGDNPLGALLASSLRGPYLFPSPNLKEIRPIPLRQHAHAHFSKVFDAA
jgi:hypothetical protein